MGIFWSSTTVDKDENLEIYSLIWLDAFVNSSQENLQAQKQLQISINHLLTYDNDEKFLQYIHTISEDERIILITSGSFGRMVVPKIAHLQQIISIYIYCIDKKRHEEWAQHFSKIKGVFIRLDELIDQIKIDQIQRQRYKADETLSISTFKSNTHDQGQTSTALNGPFIYSQLLIDCLIRMEPSSNEIHEFISLCKQQYKSNSIVNEFERNYRADQAIWWYTRDSFVYRLLNKALRKQNIRLLYLYRFFIRDLGEQLERNKCLLPVCVYRGQQISKQEIEMLKNSIGEYISMNSFLSTSLHQQKARDFIYSAAVSADTEKVLFEIDADPRLENIKPFSNITRFSYFPDEKEILFMIGTIFRLVDMTYDNNDKFWNIRLVLCSENEHQLQTLFQHIKDELDHAGMNLLRFGHILRRMGQLDDAERYYHRYLNQLPYNHPHISSCYHALGKVTFAKGDYDASLKLYNKCLEIDMETLEADHLNIAAIHNSIAIVHCKNEDYVHALKSYEEALMILQKAYSDDHPRVAECLNNIAGVYYNEEDYSKALEYHQKALIIRQKVLPEHHPHIGSSYHNIGIIDRCLGQYDRALEHYNLALQIKSKSLPSGHPDIAMTLENIGLVYEDKGDFQQAFHYFEKAIQIYRHSLPSTHPDLIKTEEKLKNISLKLKELPILNAL